MHRRPAEFIWAGVSSRAGSAATYQGLGVIAVAPSWPSSLRSGKHPLPLLLHLELIALKLLHLPIQLLLELTLLRVAA